MYGRRECLLLSCRGFWLFSDRLIGGGDGGGLSTALSLGLRTGARSPSLDGNLDPVTGVECVSLVCAYGINGTFVSGYLARIHWFVNHRFCETVRLGYGLAP